MTKPSPPSDPIAQTLAYYDQHAQEFIERTVGVSMAHLYEPFLALIPKRGRILDAGCGSGRDAAEFACQGYEVTAFDGSVEMARLASERTGLQVQHLTFDQMSWREEFDGIWACASLLHLQHQAFEGAVQRLALALRPGGILYASVKVGEFEGVRDNRWFTDLTEAALEALLTAADLTVVRIWRSEDARADIKTIWLNALAARPKLPRTA